MKISVVMEDTSRTGGIRALVELANGLTARGHDCTIVLPRGTKPVPFATTARIALVGPRLPYVANIRNVSNMLLLQRFMPPSDVIIASSWRSAFPTYWSATQQSALGLFFVQADERLMLSLSTLGKIKRRVAAAAYRLPLAWLTNSVWLRDRMGAEFNNQGTIVNPGVDLAVFSAANRRPQPPEKLARRYTIVSVGRALAIKGLPDLLAALETVSAQLPIALVLISQDDLKLDAAYPIEIVRAQSDQEIAELYRRADLFVYPSWFEGFGLPPLEAMACGTPVVTTDCGGVRDFAVDGYNTLVVPPRDPDALAEAILRMLCQPELAATLARNGIATAANYTWGHFAARAEQAILGAWEQQYATHS